MTSILHKVNPANLLYVLFSFQGRISRREWWLGAFVILAVTLALVVVGMSMDDEFRGAVSTHRRFFSALDSVTGRLSLLLGIPSTAVYVKRLHDLGRSGWWTLGLFVPIFGLIIFVALIVVKGDSGPNKYGSDPLVPG